MARLAWIGLWLVPAMAAQAAVYRCESGGQVTYTDRPCAAGAQPAVLPPIGVVPGSKGLDLAKQYDARVRGEREAHARADRSWLDAHAAEQAQARAAASAMKAGRTAPGMSTYEARQALGRPDRVRRRGDRETWTYEKDGKAGRTVIFENGRVVAEPSRSTEASTR